jgi:WhiB family redox-sensing transcriptional regulator
MEWVHLARCKDEDPELFFPVGTTGPSALQVELAKAVCALCEVRNQCLEWALATSQDSGVWGGLGEEERRALRLAQRRPADRIAVSS